MRSVSEIGLLTLDSYDFERTVDFFDQYLNISDESMEALNYFAAFGGDWPARAMGTGARLVVIFLGCTTWSQVFKCLM